MFLVQDKYEDPEKFIAEFTALSRAEDFVRELEEQDKDDNVYEEDKYTISKRLLCYRPVARKCGHNNKSICMLPDPHTQCPFPMHR